MFPLTRKIANELVMLAATTLAMCSNAAAEYADFFVATDASLLKGAVIVAQASKELVRDVWLGTEKKGSYVRLDNILRHVGADDAEEPVVPELIQPKASPLMYFDFVEICGGVGAVSKACVSLGMVVAPPLDLSASEFYNLES